MRNIVTIFLLILFFVFSNIAQYVEFELALLEQQLQALNQQLCTTKAVKSQTKLEAGSHKFNLPHLIDFDSKAIYYNLLISADINRYAPPAPLKLTHNATLTQFIVAWQGLPFKSFLNLSDQRALHTMLSYGYINKGAFLKLLRTYNSDLEQSMGSVQEEFNKLPDIDDPLIGGNMASCGYHAIKNSLIVAHAIYDSDPRVLTHIMNLSLVDDLFGTSVQRKYIIKNAIPGSWRKMVIDQRNEQQKLAEDEENPLNKEDGDWLTDEEIMWLWSQLPTEGNLYKNKRTLQFMVYGGESSEFMTLKENYQKSIQDKENFLGALLLSPSSRGKTFDHWISLIINKVADHTQFLIFDSQNYPRYHDDTIAYLIKSLLSDISFSKADQEEFDKQRAAIFETLSQR